MLFMTKEYKTQLLCTLTDTLRCSMFYVVFYIDMSMWSRKNDLLMQSSFTAHTHTHTHTISGAEIAACTSDWLFFPSAIQSVFNVDHFTTHKYCVMFCVNHY